MKRAWEGGAVPVLPTALTTLAALAFAACSPTFDWRETRLDDSTLVSMFPCSPDRHARDVALVPGERASTMRMLVCSTGGATFALSAADLADPSAAPAALKQLRAAALANVQGSEPSGAAWTLAGATPFPEAGRLSTLGRLPDGTAVVEHAVFFARGAKVYQASVIGVKPQADAVETFFGGLNFKP